MSDYVQYGPEWEQAMMKMTKAEIIDLFRQTVRLSQADLRRRMFGVLGCRYIVAPNTEVTGR